MCFFCTLIQYFIEFIWIMKTIVLIQTKYLYTTVYYEIVNWWNILIDNNLYPDNATALNLYVTTNYLRMGFKSTIKPMVFKSIM